MYVKFEKSTCLKWTYGLVGHNYWVAAQSNTVPNTKLY